MKFKDLKVGECFEESGSYFIKIIGVDEWNGTCLCIEADKDDRTEDSKESIIAGEIYCQEPNDKVKKIVFTGVHEMSK